nr:MAG TPA: hypothetical protein [Caudoviricetes sp.]
MKLKCSKVFLSMDVLLRLSIRHTNAYITRVGKLW